jgi:hypothetical protein
MSRVAFATAARRILRIGIRRADVREDVRRVARVNGGEGGGEGHVRDHRVIRCVASSLRSFRAQAASGLPRWSLFHEVEVPRNKNPGSKVRLSLELPERVRERLDELQHTAEADSITEVIRRALAVYDTIVTERVSAGATVVLRYADGHERELLIV